MDNDWIQNIGFTETKTLVLPKLYATKVGSSSNLDKDLGTGIRDTSSMYYI